MKITLKKQSLILALTMLLNQNSYATYPVIDVASIAQAVMQYTQMMKDYSQMLKDTLNFEKQMKELGVDMTNIQEIYGNVLDIINETTSLYEDLNNIPEDIYGELAKIKNTCNLISSISNTSNFTQALNQASKIDRKFNGCLNALSNNTALLDDITKKTEEILDLKSQALINRDENLEIANKIAQKEQEIQTMQQAKSYALTLKQNEANLQMLAKLDKIAEFDSKSHSQKLKNFSQQLNQPNNAKQAQALTNSLLLELVTQQQKIFELQTQYYHTELAEKNARISQVQEPKQYQKPNIKRLEDISPYFKEAQEQSKNVRFDSAGLPIFIPDTL